MDAFGQAEDPRLLEAREASASAGACQGCGPRAVELFVVIQHDVAHGLLDLEAACAEPRSGLALSILAQLLWAAGVKLDEAVLAELDGDELRYAVGNAKANYSRNPRDEHKRCCNWCWKQIHWRYCEHTFFSNWDEGEGLAGLLAFGRAP